MRLATLDFETYWATDHSLSKMLPMAYVMHPDTQLISCSIKIDNYNTDVFFGEAEISRVLKKLDWSNTMAIAHNMSGFDAMILAWRLGIKPRMWGCTLAMARPIHAKTTGLGLGKLVEHYGLGVKNNAVLLATKGRRLEDFEPHEIDQMRTYNRDDTDQCHALFHKLRPHYSAQELWHIDASIRMLVDTKFKTDVGLLETALSVERDRKRKTVLLLAKHLLTTGLGSDALRSCGTVEAVEEAVTAEMASSAKFSALLESMDVPVPMKPSPTNADKFIPALSKTDQGFIDLQDNDNELVACAARTRLSVKSTLLETRIGAFLKATEAAGGMLPIPINYCGADTTGRWSGWAYNPQNLPRINPTPRTSDALRNSLRAPDNHLIAVADQSGIELRVNHFYWQVQASMNLYKQDALADLYKQFAASRYGVAIDEVDKNQRQMGKVAHLGLGFGAGWQAFQRFAATQYKLYISDEDAQAVVEAWRVQYAEIPAGWKTCNARLQDVHDGVERAVDKWELVLTCKEGLRLPSGRIIRYPNLRKEPDGVWPDGRPKESWFYATGRHKARITGPKMTENIVQALARDTIADNAVDVYRATGQRPALMVHDELVYVVPEAKAQAHLETVQGIMRQPPKWWPELVTWSEGDIAKTYGAAK